MAAYGWGEGTPVGEALFAEGHRFGFLQAVSLLEALYPDRARVGEGMDPGREVVRFSSRVELEFPAAEVGEVRPPSRPDEPARLAVRFLGLAGEVGPLPQSWTEEILRRAKAGDRAGADFLDLFNHRLVALFYRARKKYRPALDRRPPDEGRPATCLFAFLGLGTPGLPGRMEVADRSLLAHGSLLAGLRRSMVGLTCLLSEHFGVPATVEPFRGAWLALEPGERTAIGRRGRHQALGRGVVLGSRVWDQQAGFELRLGPLGLGPFLAFLPTGQAFRALVALVRYYVGEEFSFAVRLLLAPGEMPPLRLGRAGDARLGWSSRFDKARREEVAGPAGRPESAEVRLGSTGGARLGWTSWLSTRWPPAGDSQLLLAGRP